MNDLEFKQWNARLQFAHNRWERAGWLPDSPTKATDVPFNMARYLDGYRGDFPMVLQGGVETADQMVGNIMFSIINTQTAQLSARVPDPILRPSGGDAQGREARRRAWLNEQLIEFMSVERKYKREADKALLSAILLGAGFVQHGYTPEVEFYDDNGKIITRFKNQTPDLPWIQFVRPWQLRIDPMVNCFEPDSEPRWVAFHKYHFEHQIRANENLIFRDDLTPTKFIPIDPEDERRGGSSLGDPDQIALYEEWVIYDADERKFFGISPGSQKLIRKEQEWPFEWGQLPYSYLSFNEQLDSPFPIAFPRMFYQEQILYNKIWTIINALVSRVRRIIFVRGEGGISEEEMALLKRPDALMEFIETVGNPNEVANEVGMGTIDGQLIGLLYQLKEQIREVLGVSNFDRGQRANVETAAEAQSISAGGSLMRGRTQERFEDFWTNVIRVQHRTFLQSEDSRSLIVPIIGQNNLDFLTQQDRENGFVSLDLADLQGEFSYTVKLDSTLRQDPNTEFARKATAYNLLGGVQSQLLNQRYFHEDLTELSGCDPQQAVTSEQVAGEMVNQNGPGEGEPGGDAGNGAAANQAATGLVGILGGQ